MITIVGVLVMARADVPASLLPRLESLVTPVWRPDGLGDDGYDAEVELLVTANTTLDADALDRLPGLRAIVVTSTAADGIDLDHCRARGVIVCNTPGYTGSSVAEHALTLALAANRHLVAVDAGCRRQPPAPPPLSREIAGKVAGIVGLGDIGGRLATMLHGLGMRVLFTNRSRRERADAEQVDLPGLLAQADFVFLTVPLTPDTFHLLDGKAFTRMRPGAYVVNISADELIDPAALAEALRGGRIAGAALDVIGSLDPYLGLPNVTLSQLAGWYTRESVLRRAETWLDTVEAFLAGRARHVMR